MSQAKAIIRHNDSKSIHKTRKIGNYLVEGHILAKKRYDQI